MLRDTKFHAERADCRMKSRCSSRPALSSARRCGIGGAGVPAAGRPTIPAVEPIGDSAAPAESAWQRLLAPVIEMNSMATAGQRGNERGSVIEGGRMRVGVLLDV